MFPNIMGYQQNVADQRRAIIKNSYLFSYVDEFKKQVQTLLDNSINTDTVSEIAMITE